MFTLKFMSFFEDDGHMEQCIRCPHYEARKTRQGEWSITAFPTMTTENGVERWIRRERLPEQDVSFDTCFVENENGKTIAKYHIPISR